jgi:serine/threonine protein kinase/Tol biopolymer transport system component
MTLLVGAQVGVYEILSALGAGGMGEVYRATDTVLKRQVALKILPPEVANDPERVARFQREAEVLASLNHPNIAHLYGLERSGGTLALVMELVEGPTLADRIAKGAIPLDEALPIAKQIAEALEVAHEQGIIHRDLKPANIKVRDDGTVKVLDFGLAKAMEPAAVMRTSVSMSPTITTPAMTLAGIILGTAAYMSPEQAAGRSVDKRSDIWSFGVVLWEMLTGKQLFAGETISHTLADVLRAEIDFSSLPAKTPQSVRTLLRRCLDRDVKRRLRDVGEARIATDQAIADPQGGATLTLESAEVKRRRWRRSAALLFTSGISAAIVVAVIALYVRPFVLKPVTDERGFQFRVGPPAGMVFRSGYGGGAAISPDGRTIAFVAGSGRSSLWVRRLDVLAAHELPGTTGAAYPFWSPDSRSIGFFAEGKLNKIDVSGGPPVFITAALNPRGGSWGSGGTIVFGPTEGALQRVAASGAQSAVTNLDPINGETSHRWPQLLPDGRHVLYFVRTMKPHRDGIYLSTLDRPNEKVFLVESASSGVYVPPHGKTSSGYLLWVRGNTLMAQAFDPARAQLSGDPNAIAAGEVGTFGSLNLATFSASQEGTVIFGGANDQYRLTWFSRNGTDLGTVGMPDGYGAVRISPDGKRVAVAINATSGGRDLWQMDVARGLPNRVTSNGGNVPVWSRDGRQIAYHDTSLTRLSVIGADGDQRHTLFESKSFVYINDWSPDGQFLLYTEINPKTLGDLRLLPITGDRVSVPLLVTPFSESHGQFSPDGRWIAYTSNDSGQEEIYVRGVKGNQRVRCSASGGSFSRWPKNDKELFYRSLDGRLMAVAVGNDGDRPTCDSPIPLFQIIEPLGAEAWPYDVSADGQHVLALTPSAGDRDAAALTVIVNWEAGLPKSN